MPKTQLATTNVFSDDETAIASIMGAYAKLSPGNLNYSDRATLLTDLAADNGYYFSGITFDVYEANTISSSDFYIASQFWAVPYQTIYMCNAIIEGLTSSNKVTSKTKTLLMGEALFLRAFCYFHLANYFGDVPLITVTDVNITSVTPRTNVADVYQQIITDLLSAKDVLPASYTNGQKTRANKWSALALLSRVSLYLKDYSKAEMYAGEVINSSAYTLPSDLNLVFLNNSTEAIWQLWTVNGFTYIGQNTIPSSTQPKFVLTNDFISSLETGDQRLTKWIQKLVYNSNSYYYAYKYKQRMLTANATAEYYMALRLGEQYLIRAEARANLNDIPGAQSDINTIRNRAGLANTTANTQTTLNIAIEKERRSELFWEWGHRWFDLKRTNRANSILGRLKPNWHSTSVLWPIPQSEILRNSFLIQNPGY